MLLLETRKSRIAPAILPGDGKPERLTRKFNRTFRAIAVSMLAAGSTAFGQGLPPADIDSFIMEWDHVWTLTEDGVLLGQAAANNNKVADLFSPDEPDVDEDSLIDNPYVPDSAVRFTGGCGSEPDSVTGGCDSLSTRLECGLTVNGSDDITRTAAISTAGALQFVAFNPTAPGAVLEILVNAVIHVTYIQETTFGNITLFAFGGVAPQTDEELFFPTLAFLNAPAPGSGGLFQAFGDFFENDPNALTSEDGVVTLDTTLVIPVTVIEGEPYEMDSGLSISVTTATGDAAGQVNAFNTGLTFTVSSDDPNVTFVPVPEAEPAPAPKPAPNPAPTPSGKLDPAAVEQQLETLNKQLASARKLKNPKARARVMSLVRLKIKFLKSGIDPNSPEARLNIQLLNARNIKNPKARAKAIATLRAKLKALQAAM